MPTEAQEPWAEALEGKGGREYWRGLSEFLKTPDHAEAAQREFPEGADTPPDGVTRRSFMQLAGASVALAGVAGCAQPPAQKILPYTAQPRDVTLGVPTFYATTMVVDGFAVGTLAECHTGRPVKMEGNPAHPSSNGATGVLEQAAILSLYDPDRGREITEMGWGKAWSDFATLVGAKRTDRGRGLRFLMEPTSSPLNAALMRRLLEVYPDAKVTFHSGTGPLGRYAGARMAFGKPVQPIYSVLDAKTLVSLGADVFGRDPQGIRLQGEWADVRRQMGGVPPGNRLYVAEASLTVTGMVADERLRLKPSDIEGVARALLAAVAAAGATLPDGIGQAASAPQLAPAQATWVQAVAKELVANRGAGVVFVGDDQPPVVHAIGYVLNLALGNDSSNFTVTEATLLGAGAEGHPLTALVQEMTSGAVDTLVVLGANPAYDAPADVDFAGGMAKVATTVTMAQTVNETARLSRWYVPAQHFLESWGDALSYEGTLSFIQPMISPLFDSKTTAEVLAAFLGESTRTPYELLRALHGGDKPEWEAIWEKALVQGFVEGTLSKKVDAQLDAQAIAQALRATAAAKSGMELQLTTDYKVWDGRYGNNPWLQELPDPITKLTWDNAALLSPRTAVAQGLSSEDVIDVTLGGRTIRIPVLVVPGQADDVVSIQLGYGRTADEKVSKGIGVSAYALRTAAAPHFAPGVTVAKVGGRHRLALTQTHWTMRGEREKEDRPIALAYTVEELQKNPHVTEHHRGPVLNLLPAIDKGHGEQWAMSIDMSICNGCSACVVACQSENNTQVVGKDDVLRSREMHWIRIDRYFTGEIDDPKVVNQPQMCQHCEKAPCEYVCPVNATTHSVDGLNDMVYNRCVGTRFCSNNCPYKARRFNWFDYSEMAPNNPELYQLGRNPDVTVRERGVMEKCTYCVQRIRQVEINARNQGREIKDGEIQTACQQVCPSRAITFGSIHRSSTKVSMARRDPRSYEVLHEVGTVPRTQYLVKVENPNPELRK